MQSLLSQYNGDQYIAIILGMETNGLAVVRALARSGVPVVIVETTQNARQPHLSTKYGVKFFLDSLPGLPLLDFLRRFPRKGVLFPTTDRQVTWLSRNRDLLPAHIKLLMPSHETVRTLLDKVLFFDFCESNRVPLAPFRHVQAGADIKQAAQGLRFPVIIKTHRKVYTPMLEKAYIALSMAELVTLWKKISSLYHIFIVQEFIPGGDETIFFCLQFIDSKNQQLLASFTGRKIRQWKPRCGGTASCEPVTMPKLHEMTYEILTKAGFWGIGSVEYKRDRRNGKFYIIEPTVCRTDFQEQIAIANGVNIPWIAYQNAVGMPVQPVIANGGKKAWMHIMNDRLAADYYRKQHQLPFWSWLYSLRKVRSFDLFSVTDPGPGLAVFWQHLRKKFL